MGNNKCTQHRIITSRAKLKNQFFFSFLRNEFIKFWEYSQYCQYCQWQLTEFLPAHANNVLPANSTPHQIHWIPTDYYYYYYYYRFIPRWAGTRKVKPGKYNQSGFTVAKDSEWQWHQLRHPICKSAPHPRQITTPAPHHSFLGAGCPSCHPTNSVKVLKAKVQVKSALYFSQLQMLM